MTARRLQVPMTTSSLAGEAVGINNPATVHGAVLSGRYAAADRCADWVDASERLRSRTL